MRECYCPPDPCFVNTYHPYSVYPYNDVNHYYPYASGYAHTRMFGEKKVDVIFYNDTQQDVKVYAMGVGPSCIYKMVDGIAMVCGSAVLGPGEGKQITVKGYALAAYARIGDEVCGGYSMDSNTKSVFVSSIKRNGCSTKKASASDINCFIVKNLRRIPGVLSIPLVGTILNSLGCD